jgi:hypothetical protein
MLAFSASPSSTDNGKMPMKVVISTPRSRDLWPLFSPVPNPTISLSVPAALRKNVV